MLSGIGFTMSIFTRSLAFEGENLMKAKVGVLIASVISAAVGLVWLGLVLPRRTRTN